MTDRTTDRRSALKLIGAGALAMPAIWRPSAARAQSKVVNVTTYDKFLPQAFVDKFQRETGLEVRVRLTDDQGKQYNLLAAEGGAPTTDIVTVAGHRLSQFIASSLIVPLDTGRIGNWKNLSTVYSNADWLKVDGKVYGVPMLAGFEGLARNTTNTKASDSWEIMFDQKYKGFTSYIVGDFLSVTMKYQGNDGDFVTYKDRDAAQKATNQARDFLIKNKLLVRKYYDGAAEVQQMFLNEDIYLAQTWSGPASKLIMDGQPIELSVPKEGTYGFCYTFNIVKNAPNADNAYKLLDSILASPDVGAAMTRQSGFTSTMSGVDKVLNERERKASALPDTQMERVQFFSAINRALKNELVDRATAEIKAA